MIKQALRDSTLYSLAAIFSRSIIVLQVPLFAHALLPADFGMADLLIVFVTLINFVVGLEVSQAVAIYYSESKDSAAKTAIASTALWFTLAVYTVFTVLGLAFSEAAAELLLDRREYSLLVQFAVCIAFAQGLLTLTQNQLRWMLKAKPYFAANIANGAVNLGVACLYIFNFKVGIYGLLTGQLLGALAGAAISVYSAREAYRFVFSSARLKTMLRFSFPLVPSSISGYLALYIDRICIKEIISIEAVGIYGVAFRFASVVGVVIAGFVGSVSPLIYNRQEDPETPAHVAVLFRISLFLGLCMILFLGLFSYEIFVLLSSPEYYAGHTLLPTLAASLLISYLYTFTPGLTIGKRTVTIAVISLAAAFLNLALNFSLVPHLGIQGSALATIISASVSFLWWYKLGQSSYAIPIRWAKPLACACVTAGIVYLGYKLPAGFALTPLLVKGTLFVVGLKVLLLTALEKSELKKLGDKIKQAQR